MIKVEPILDIIETSLWTGIIKDEKPLSVILIAGVGSGKSAILGKSYKAPKIKEEWHNVKGRDGNTSKERTQTVTQIGTVLYTTDSTPYTLYHKYGDLLRSNKVKHIVIPDFLSILTKNKEAMPDTIRFYNSLIEEGIFRIESRYSDFVTEVPVQVGLITAVSSQDYDIRRKTQNWGAMGFLSRVLPVSYSYTNSTKGQIMHSTFLREYHTEVNFELKFPDKPIYVDLPLKYEKRITKLANSIKDTTDEVGARRQKQLMTFVMGTALKHGRDVVNDEDVDILMGYSRFFNSECETEL